MPIEYSGMEETPDFGLADHLVQVGVLSAEVAEACKAHAVSGFKPLGRILLDRKCLALHQLSLLLQLQVVEPDALIGTLAVREGYCTVEDIEEALTYQRDVCPDFIDSALRDHGVDPIELARGTVSYIRHVEQRLSMLTYQRA